MGLSGEEVDVRLELEVKEKSVQHEEDDRSDVAECRHALVSLCTSYSGVEHCWDDQDDHC